jgi:hypothetical protein
MLRLAKFQLNCNHRTSEAASIYINISQEWPEIFSPLLWNIVPVHTTKLFNLVLYSLNFPSSSPISQVLAEQCKILRVISDQRFVHEIDRGDSLSS